MTRPLVLLLTLLAIACGRGLVLPPEPEPLPPEDPAAAPLMLRVEGVVVDRFGYAVPDAWVTARVGSPHDAGPGDGECRDASHLPTRTRTTPTGGFVLLVEPGRRAPFRACLEVEAIPPPGLPWRENTVVVPSVQFSPATQEGAPTEAVSVRLVLY